MKSKKKIIITLGVFLLTFSVVYLSVGVHDYLEFVNVAKSDVMGGKMQEAGRITMVNKCILDTPLSPLLPLFCDISCPLLSPSLKVMCTQPIKGATDCIVAANSASQDPVTTCEDQIAGAVDCVNCASFYEIPITMAQKGNIFMGLPITFLNFKGGGTFPQPGMQFMWLGSSNISPYVMGIPSVAASNVQKLVNAYDFIIAGFKQ